MLKKIFFIVCNYALEIIPIINTDHHKNHIEIHIQSKHNAINNQSSLLIAFKDDNIKTIQIKHHLPKKYHDNLDQYIHNTFNNIMQNINTEDIPTKMVKTSYYFLINKKDFESTIEKIIHQIKQNNHSLFEFIISGPIEKQEVMKYLQSYTKSHSSNNKITKIEDNGDNGNLQVFFNTTSPNYTLYFNIFTIMLYDYLNQNNMINNFTMSKIYKQNNIVNFIIKTNSEYKANQLKNDIEQLMLSDKFLNEDNIKRTKSIIKKFSLNIDEKELTKEKLYNEFKLMLT